MSAHWIALFSYWKTISQVSGSVIVISLLLLLVPFIMAEVML
nr:MAG TPA: hypothetical protein [Caudoviricetes sp.]